MKRTLPQATTLAVIIAASTVLSQTGWTADVIKADTADNLNLGASWVGGAPPTSADVGLWNNTVTINTSSALGADTNWAGIKILDPAGPITISAGNTNTLGASGVDLSGASQDLTLNSGVNVGASQTWSVPAGRILTVGSALAGPAASVLTKTGDGTLHLSATVNGTFAGNLSINGGVLQLNGANANNNSAAGTGVITNNGATLRAAAGRIIGNALQFNGTCILDANSVTVPFDGAWAGSGTVIISNLITGATLTAGGNGNGGGSWTAFTGTVLLGSNPGNFRFNNGGGNNTVGNAGATIDLGTSTCTLTTRNRIGSTISIGTLRGGPNTRITIGSNGTGSTTYSVGALGVASTFAGSITGDVAASPLALTKVGSSSLRLTGTNTYLGATTVNAGTLIVGDGATSGQTGVGSIVINNGATLLYDRLDDTFITNQIGGAAGTFIKTNNNTLNYYGTNNSAGVTLYVYSGTLSMGEGAQILGKVLLNTGAVLAVTNAPTFVFNGTLAGNGTATGNLTAAAGSTLSPGDAGVAGALAFEGGLTLQGGLTYAADLSNDANIPSANDRINVTGDLNASGVTTISINSLTSLTNSEYTLITYSGAFNGTTNNFVISGAYGSISNPPGAITFTPLATRSTTNLTWVGDGAANDWDTLVSTNWVSGATPFTFIPGDNVRFDNGGAANPTVSLVGDVAPKSVVVDATSDYTFTGLGRIVGAARLSKSNTAVLTIVTTNNAYTGPTMVAGGTLGIATVAIAGADSSIGRASVSPTNLVLINSTLRYDGLSASTDRGATLNGVSDIINVVSGTENLTIGGTVAGTAGLVKNGAGTLTLSVANSYAGGTVISNGVLALGSNEANSSGSQSGLGPTNTTVTFYGGTLELFGYNGSTTPLYNTFRNPLVVPAGQTGTLRLFPRGPVNTGANSGLASTLTGAGTLNLVVNYVRDNLSGDWSAFTGLINVTPRNPSGDEMRINNNAGYANATIFLNDAVNLDRADTANTTNNIGELGGTSLSTVGPGNASGANTTWRVGFKNTTNTFAGSFAGNNNILKVGTGKWILTGQNTHTGFTIISNGVIALGDGVTDGAISGSTISVISGAFLDATAIIATPATLMLSAGAVLQGDGTLLGNLDNSAGGTVAPGVPQGTFNVTGPVTLGGAGIFEARIDRNKVPNSGKLNAPSITLGGTLVVTNLGAALQVGDTFDLLDGPLSGSFTSVVLPNYHTWNTNNLGVDGTISVTGILPGPTFSTVDGSLIAFGQVTLNATNGAPNGQYVVLSSTNLALPSNWTPVVTNAFDAGGNMTGQIITFDPAVPQQFFMLRAY